MQNFKKLNFKKLKDFIGKETNEYFVERCDELIIFEVIHSWGNVTKLLVIEDFELEKILNSKKHERSDFLDSAILDYLIKYSEEFMEE